MKTRKVLALVILSAMLVSMMPMMAFGAFDLSRTEIILPSGSIAATSRVLSGTGTLIDGTEDGQEFKLILTNDGEWDDIDIPVIHVASSRPTVDVFFYKLENTWKRIPDGKIYQSTGVGISARSIELTLKVISMAQGTSRIAFGIEPKGPVGDENKYVGHTQKYASQQSGTDTSLILNYTRYPIEFTAPKAETVTLDASSGKKYANGVDSYTITATVLTGAGVPASGIDVNFSITSGNGARLSASKATTNAAGKAEVKVYSTRQGDVTIQARVSGIAAAKDESDKVTVTFDSTGIVSIKAESDDNQKVARGDKPASFRISAYDVNANRVDFTGMGINPDDYDNVTSPKSTAGRYVGPSPASKLELYAEIVTKPSGAALVKDDIYYAVHKNSGNLDIKIPINRLNKDGGYEVKVYLPNGVSVVYKFSVKDQGDVVKLILDYGSNSYSASTYVPEPEVVTEDAEGYSVRSAYADYSNSKALSISDASFLDGKMAADGSFKLKDDKSGVLTMTVVDKTLSLVATQELTIQKSASYLKMTPAAVGAVGGEVTVNIELVDVDGKLAAVGLDAETYSATVVTKPADSIASASTVDTSDFSKGKSNVKVSCNTEGDVVVRVIITEKPGIVPGSGTWVPPVVDAGGIVTEPGYYKDQDTWGGRTYTGACTVSFGKAGASGGTLIFIIGAPSFVTGNTPHAAESPAFIENGRTFLGVRDVGTAIGATVNWDQDTNTATIAKDNIVVAVTVGADKIAVTKAGVTTEVATDAPAQNVAGRVYLPFRVLLETFGYTVTWDQATQSIICTI